MPGALRMKICSMYGCELRARRPIMLPLIGVSRHPRTVSPSSRAIFSRIPSHSIRSCGSTGRNTMPTPYSPGAGRENPRRAHSRSKKACGIWIRMPAPSPVCGSQPHAPRCVEVDQDLDALEDDVVRLPALNIRDESDAASIVLVLRAIQALSGRQTLKWVDFLHVSRALRLGIRDSATCIPFSCLAIPDFTFPNVPASFSIDPSSLSDLCRPKQAPPAKAVPPTLPRRFPSTLRNVSILSLLRHSCPVDNDSAFLCTASGF